MVTRTAKQIAILYLVSFEAIRENLSSRDKEDTSRKENPLTQAEDAVVLDSKMEEEEYFVISTRTCDKV